MSYSTELDRVYRMLSFAKNTWGPQVGEELQVRLEYAYRVNEWRRLGLTGRSLSRNYFQALTEFKELAKGSDDLRGRRWSWLKNEAMKNTIGSLMRNMGPEEFSAFESIRGQCADWFATDDKYCRTRKNTELRVKAVVTDHKGARLQLDEMLEDDKMRREEGMKLLLSRGDALYHAHSRILALDKLEERDEAIAQAVEWSEYAYGLGFKTVSNQLLRTARELESASPKKGLRFFGTGIA